MGRLDSGSAGKGPRKERVTIVAPLHGPSHFTTCIIIEFREWLWEAETAGDRRIDRKEVGESTIRFYIHVIFHDYPEYPTY